MEPHWPRREKNFPDIMYAFIDIMYAFIDIFIDFLYNFPTVLGFELTRGVLIAMHTSIK